MNQYPQAARLNKLWLWTIVLAITVLTVLPIAAQDDSSINDSKQDRGIGLVANHKVTAKDLGLPIYPGARPFREKPDEDRAVQFGAWSNASGFKLVVLKLQSDEKPDKIAAFYRKALGRYGEVLNCSGVVDAKKSDEKHDSKRLVCDDRPKAGELELKAGTNDDQHVVSIEPKGSGTAFALAYVEQHGSSDK